MHISATPGSHFATICLLHIRILRIIIKIEGSSLHVISRKKLLAASDVHGDLAPSLDVWYRIAKRAAWKSLQEVRRELPSADGAGEYTVFNIKGNSYRLITLIFYQTQRIYIRDVLTHAEYDKERWKQ